MKHVKEFYTCDMCGAEIDANSDDVRLKSILCRLSNFNSIPIHEHNPSYDEEYQTGMRWERIDLCPECADRATAIHCEVVPTEDGRSCRHELSWRDGR